MMKIYLFFIFLLMPSLALGDDDDAVRKYIEELETSNTAIFYSHCQLKTGKASLVFPVGEKRGLYIERSGNRVVNSAVVTLAEDRWDMEDAHGGLYTIRRVGNLVSELLSYPFELIMPENLKRIATSKPKKQCVEKLPE